MLSIDWQMFAAATWQTLYMVGVASIISIFVGGFFGILLYVLRQKQQHSISYAILGFIVNIFRSIPFIILLILLIPFTRLLIGSSIGATSAIIPLAVAAIPFYARIMETALNDVDPGLLKAADAMGMNRKQTIFKVMLPEALGVLLQGATLLTISLIGFSAMAGAVGGGGLGEVAIDYGYQQFNLLIMLQTVVILIVLVQLVQYFGNLLSRKVKLLPFTYGAIASLSILLAINGLGARLFATSGKELKVGIVAGPEQQVMQIAKQLAWHKYHLRLNIIAFDDFLEPNRALNEGSVDVNIFQHLPFLEAQIKKHGYNLQAVAKTFIYPYGFYSKKITNINQLASGAQVVLPADPSNLGRALLLLQKHKLIRLVANTGLFPTLNDIRSNPDNLQFKLADAAMIPRLLPDVAMAGINNNYLTSLGLKAKDAVLIEGKDSPYANVIVVRKGHYNKRLVHDLILVMHSKEIVQKVLQLYPDGASVPAWPGAVSR